MNSLHAAKLDQGLFLDRSMHFTKVAQSVVVRHAGVPRTVLQLRDWFADDAASVSIAEHLDRADCCFCD
jgi:hypothetical protein